MSNFKFKLNRSGVRELLRSSEMQGVLDNYATNIQAKCGEGYITDIYVGKNRANAMISTSTYQASADNMKNNTILKAVGAK